MEPEGSLPHSQQPATSPYPKPVHSPPFHLLKIYFILSWNLRLGVPGGFFPSGLLTKALYAPLLSPLRATCLAHPNSIWWGMQIIKLLVMYSSPFPSYLVPLRHPILEHPHPSFSLNMSDQVSHPYKTAGKIIVLYILFGMFLDIKLEDKRFHTELEQTFPDFNLFLISSRVQFGFDIGSSQILHPS